ncbi:MAG: hypothetical protein H7Y20_08300 [Bryobacteraceae bacterium]|nr:hypothetical protein [Bryobacteraceae bacterium]
MESRIFRTQIQTTIRPAAIPNEIVAKKLVLTSVHSGTVACYRHLASDASPVDVVKSSTLIFPIVDLKPKSPG